MALQLLQELHPDIQLTLLISAAAQAYHLQEKVSIASTRTGKIITRTTKAYFPLGFTLTAWTKTDGQKSGLSQKWKKKN